MSGWGKKGTGFHLSEDTSYKIVAFLVTLVLWVTILGRRNSVMTKDMNVEYLVRNNYIVTNDARKSVRIQLSGPRMILKQYLHGDQAYTVDLWNVGLGKHQLRLSQKGLNLPAGVKLLSVTPKDIVVVIKESSDKNEDK